MDLTAIRESTLQMERQSWRQMAESPSIDRHHFEREEDVYTTWTRSLGAAGVVAPNLLAACVSALAGYMWATIFPRRWAWSFALLTAGYVARGLAVSSKRS
jgi:hypothetical protein